MSWPVVIVLVPAERRPELESRFRALGPFWHWPTPQDDQVQWGGSAYSLDLSGEVLRDYEPEHLDEVTARIGEPYAVRVASESMDAARALLRHILPGLAATVDTDHWELIPSDDFLGLLARHPGWDWRRVPSTELPGGPGPSGGSGAGDR
ncbi:hypothetical protein ACFXPX_33085 [Kitasatospora sp. NPDC059146]|uniref:hypothetical protein n=1 Tax=Kitasatospora sp. NPDC059146 TaxID=3346741 RepID=UPI0036BB7AD0